MEALRQRALKSIPQQPLNAEGEVCKITEDEMFCVRTCHGELHAQRAASCLLWPEEGDRVLVSGEFNSGLYITAVLERMSESPMRLVLSGETIVTMANDADISFQVNGSLRFKAKKQIEIDTSEMSLVAGSATVLCKGISLIARNALASIRESRLVGELLESAVDRIRLSASHSERQVKGIDRVRSGNIDYSSRQTLHLQAENLMAGADKLVKLDGDQIQIG